MQPPSGMVINKTFLSALLESVMQVTCSIKMFQLYSKIIQQFSKEALYINLICMLQLKHHHTCIRKIQHEGTC